MTFNEIKTYFENYARLHVVLKHTDANPSFFALNNDKNADDFIRNLKQSTIMVLMTYDKKLFPPRGENYNWDKSLCFFVLKRSTTKNADIVQAQNDCEIIGNDFCSRLIDDRNTLITGFVQESFAMMPVGPMSDNFFGQACLFSMVDNYDYRVDESRWV